MVLATKRPSSASVVMRTFIFGPKLAAVKNNFIQFSFIFINNSIGRFHDVFVDR
jgi:hypothetical protein